MASAWTGDAQARARPPMPSCRWAGTARSWNEPHPEPYLIVLIEESTLFIVAPESQLSHLAAGEGGPLGSRLSKQCSLFFPNSVASGPASLVTRRMGW